LSESDRPAVTRTAWFHCFSGVSGDMTLGALIDAGADPVAIGQILNTLGIDGWTAAACPEPVERAVRLRTRRSQRPADER
jgi:rhodanese-related sulfurtransferase